MPTSIETIERLKVALEDGSLDDVNGLTLELKRKFMAVRYTTAPTASDFFVFGGMERGSLKTVRWMSMRL